MLFKYIINSNILFFIIILIINDNSFADSFSYLKHSDAVKTLDEQRKIFLATESALKKSNNSASKTAILNKVTPALADYPLYPYLEYMVLQQSIGNLSIDKLKNFVDKYQNTPLNQSLQESWLLHNAKLQKWENFLAGYNQSKNIELNCYFIQAQYKFNNGEKFNEKIKTMWLTGRPQPKSCDAVFELWKKQGFMTRSMIWQRIKLAIAANKLSFAKHLGLNYLEKYEHPIIDLWIKVHNNPTLILKKEYFTTSHQAVSEILMDGILNIAKKNPEEAVKYWDLLSKTYSFNERHYNYIIKAIALALGKSSRANAYEWFKKIPKEYRDHEVYNLQLVLFLKEAKWKEIISIYAELPPELKQQEKWLYWYARALEMHNHEISSKKILIDLATKRSYYGFLSSAKLLRPYSFKFKPVAVNSNQMNSLLKNKAVQRAYELLQLNRINQASKEWNLALKTMVEWELHTAAKLADNLNMPNWAITALSDAKEQDDLSLRFPKYYSKYIINEANKNQLDPAWVFAVTRQESAFRPNVKSYAGALGLMQLMPKTGFMVAQAIKINLKNHNDILDINNNVKLGSKYLQLMLDRYKNMVVATAAYNAGPGRIQKWLPDYEIAADLWVETIPFKDTKEYVQNVMTYTVIYQKLLGKNHYLNMPLIKKI